jgi:hypothetical protein
MIIRSLRLPQDVEVRRAPGSLATGSPEKLTASVVNVGPPVEICSSFDIPKRLNTRNLQQFSSQKAASLVSRFRDH